MNEHEKINKEIEQTLELLGETGRVSVSSDFSGAVGRRLAMSNRQVQNAVKYKFFVLLAVLLVTAVNFVAFNKAAARAKCYKSATVKVMEAGFEKTRLGVFWPII